MRILLFLLALAATPAAGAAPSNGSAQLFAERAALLAADGQCALLAPKVRAALQATLTQARFAAMRDGWNSIALDAVARRANASGRSRDCADPVLRGAAHSAQEGYRGWAKLPSMEFPGTHRVWSAQRARDLDGWILSQSLSDGARFGLATDEAGRDQVVLALPIGPGPAPASASLFLRDAARAPRALLDVPGMTAQSGLQAGVAPRSLQSARLASQRVRYAPKGAPARLLFLFPADVLAEIAALDPRETVAVEVSSSGPPRHLYIEVGDLASAYAFLSAATS